MSKYYLRRTSEVEEYLSDYRRFYTHFKRIMIMRDQSFGTSDTCPNYMEYSFYCLLIQSQGFEKQTNLARFLEISPSIADILMEREAKNPSKESFIEYA